MVEPHKNGAHSGLDEIEIHRKVENNLACCFLDVCLKPHTRHTENKHTRMPVREHPHVTVWLLFLSYMLTLAAHPSPGNMTVLKGAGHRKIGARTPRFSG